MACVVIHSSQTENRELNKRTAESEASPPPARTAAAPYRPSHGVRRPRGTSESRRVGGVHVLRPLDGVQRLDDQHNVAMVASAAKGVFPSRYELRVCGDLQCPWVPDLDAVAARSSFPATLSEPGGGRTGAHSTPLGESHSATLGRPASFALLSTPPGALLRTASPELLSRRSSRSANSPQAFSPTCCASAPAYLHPPAFAESPSFAIDSRLESRQGAT